MNANPTQATHSIQWNNDNLTPSNMRIPLWLFYLILFAILLVGSVNAGNHEERKMTIESYYDIYGDFKRIEETEEKQSRRFIVSCRQ